MKLTLIKLRVSLLFAVFVLFLSVFANRVTFAKTPAIQNFDVTQNNLPNEYVWTTNLSGKAKNVFQSINLKREAKKLKPLAWDNKLANIAFDYSKKMGDEGFFSHYDREGNSVVERVEDSKIKNWKKVGENLFQSFGYDDPVKIAVNGWLKSKTHKRNIYDREWTHTGVGVYTTRKDEVFITQVFMKK